MLAHLKIRKKVSIWFFFSLGGGKVMIISISEVSSSSSRGRRGPPAGHQLPASSSYGRWESPLSSVIQGTNSLPPPYKPRSCNKMHRHAMKHSSFVKFLEVCSVHLHLYIIGNYFVRWENFRRIKRTFSFCKLKGIVGRAWGKTK